MHFAMSPEELTTWVSTISASILMLASVGLTIYQRVQQARFESRKRNLDLENPKSVLRRHRKTPAE